MNKEAIIVWHYYENGKLVNYSITRFTGDDAQLADCLRRDDISGGRRNENKKEGERIGILHQVIIL